MIFVCTLCEEMSRHQSMTSLIAIMEWSNGRPQHRRFESRRQPAFLFSVGSCGAALVKVTMTLHRYHLRIIVIVVSFNLGRFRGRADSVHRLPAATYVTISRDALHLVHHSGWSSGWSSCLFHHRRAKDSSRRDVSDRCSRAST